MGSVQTLPSLGTTPNPARCAKREQASASRTAGDLTQGTAGTSGPVDPVGEPSRWREAWMGSRGAQDAGTGARDTMLGGPRRQRALDLEKSCGPGVARVLVEGRVAIARSAGDCPGAAAARTAASSPRASGRSGWRLSDRWSRAGAPMRAAGSVVGRVGSPEETRRRCGAPARGAPASPRSRGSMTGRARRAERGRRAAR